MATPRKTASAKSVRQDGTIPAPVEAKQQLIATYNRFSGENKPYRRNEAGKDLIRTIFGKDAIAQG